MKKLSIVLYAVIFLAIGVLFFLQFSGNKHRNITKSAAGIPAGDIAYVNIDSVIINFNMFADKRDALVSKSKDAEAELNSKGGQYEKAARDYQDKATKGLITRATAAQIEQSLVQQQQELVNLRDKLQSNLVEEEQVMNRQVLEYITTYLDEHKSEYNYKYILGKSFGSVILYSDNALDITQQVLDGLNKKYQAEKK
ncbi:MAG TPA: OmpH family outer membrane protein [Bacteroidales bacterium]|nr:OmpH family outer membrane protein [Bacteroidales bacterium]HPT22068.1 OmpH family outer membrane protein [Bacteroidales bacterium]